MAASDCSRWKRNKKSFYVLFMKLHTALRASSFRARVAEGTTEQVLTLSECALLALCGKLFSPFRQASFSMEAEKATRTFTNTDGKENGTHRCVSYARAAFHQFCTNWHRLEPFPWKLQLRSKNTTPVTTKTMNQASNYFHTATPLACDLPRAMRFLSFLSFKGSATHRWKICPSRTISERVALS